MSCWCVCCKDQSLHRTVPTTKVRMKFRRKRSFLHSDVTATQKYTVAATCILAAVSTCWNLTTRTRCGGAKCCTIECITRDDSCSVSI